MLNHRKNILLALLLVLMLVVSACSSGDENDENNATNDTENAETTESAKEDENTIEKDTEINAEEDSANEDNESNVTEKGKQTAEELNVKDDEELKEEIETEAGVSSANVTLMDGQDENYVLVDITLADGIEANAEEIATKYGELIKEQYKDRVVDVKVLQGEETLFQQSF